MKYRQSKTFFGHLSMYQLSSGFVIPISMIIDSFGITICFGFWGIYWSWKNHYDEESEE